MKKMITAMLTACITFTGLGLTAIGAPAAYADETFRVTETITVLSEEQAAEINSDYESELGCRPPESQLLQAGDYKIEVFATGKKIVDLGVRWYGYSEDHLIPLRDITATNPNALRYDQGKVGGLPSAYVNSGAGIFTYNALLANPRDLTEKSLCTVYLKANTPYTGDDSIFPTMEVAECRINKTLDDMTASVAVEEPVILIPAEETEATTTTTTTTTKETTTTTTTTTEETTTTTTTTTTEETTTATTTTTTEETTTATTTTTTEETTTTTITTTTEETTTAAITTTTEATTTAAITTTAEETTAPAETTVTLSPEEQAEEDEYQYVVKNYQVGDFNTDGSFDSRDVKKMLDFSISAKVLECKATRSMAYLANVDGQTDAEGNEITQRDAYIALRYITAHSSMVFEGTLQEFVQECENPDSVFYMGGK